MAEIIGSSTQSTPGFFRILNVFMKAVLRSPLHGMVSQNIMLITFTGRKSGKRYTTPVSYLQGGKTVQCFTHAAWWKNLRGGAPVTLRLRGRDYTRVAEPVIDDKGLIAKGIRKLLTKNPIDARAYNIALDQERKPVAEDVFRAAETTIMVQVQLDEF